MPSESPENPSLAAVSRWRRMLLIRRFEETVARLLAERRLGGTTHLCIGQEAVAVGVCGSMERRDQVVSNHRGHGHLLAKGGDPARLLAELAGRVAGYCRGKGGSQHVAVPDIGFMGSNGITGGGIPIALGLALAAKRAKDDRVVVSMFGDGACATGNFHECLNMAALWRVPLIFCCENNLYAMSHPAEAGLSAGSPTRWAASYGDMPVETVDGNDVEAVRGAYLRLAEKVRQGGGPAFLEALTYRLCGHSRSDARLYRTREEEDTWKERDPIRRSGEALRDQGLGEQLEAMKESVEEEIAAAVAHAMASPPGDEALARGGLFAPEETP